MQQNSYSKAHDRFPSNRLIFLMPSLMKTFHTLRDLIAATAEQSEIKNDCITQDGGGDDSGFIPA